jgi:dinuclear metal center YbgI/SA1388 family protein
MIIKELTAYLETLAPLQFQESYDNSGLILGSKSTEIKGVLVSLDVTEAVLEEAIRKGCNVIVAHHPLIFKGLKKINGNNATERIIIKAIKNDIAVYGIHTNLDNISSGVNFKIAERLGLQNVKVLRPKTETLLKLSVLVPESHADALQVALFAAGAGKIGNYENCSFTTIGTGTFTPTQGAEPYLGELNKAEKVSEVKIEVILPHYLHHKVTSAMKASHPYEEVAYYLSELLNENQEVGAGAIGEFTQPLAISDLLGSLKRQMNAKVIRHTELCFEKISKVAVCGGVGSFLLQDAIQAGAQVFLSSDFKYHEFFEAENKIIITDIGHFESEQFTKDLILEKLSKKFTNFASYLSEVDTNPIKYFH